MLDALATAPHPHSALAGLSRPAVKSDVTWESTGLWAALLDELDYGIILVEPHGEIVHVNRQARRQLQLEGPSSIWGCALCAVDSLPGQRLKHAIRQSSERGLRGAVQLRSPNESLVVSVIPLQLRASLDGSLTMLLLQRPQIYTELALTGFAKLHGLTDTETSVLSALCEGRAAQGIAQRQGVALSTVRTQLQSLRSKLGVDSVRALIHLVGRLPPVMGVLCSERK
ncbi:MAG: LuxR C-terminal-related transcriptional regulator [Acidovorax sp.]